MIDGQLIMMQTSMFPLQLWFQNIAYCDVNDVSIVYKKKLAILWLYDYGNDGEAGSHEKIPT